MKTILLTLLLIVVVSGRKGFGPGEQEWGYAEVRPGAKMFWWLYYTTAPGNPEDKPLILWFQGGPGGSSTGFGNFGELGPLDQDLKPRNHSWVKDANIMFVDNPVGTGFSYVTSSSLLTRNNEQIASDFVRMLSIFLKQFPKFKSTPLYMTCESYGGKMVAEFAHTLLREVEQGNIEANLKGIFLGDSWISPIDSVMNWAPYLLEFGAIDDRGYKQIDRYARLVKQYVDQGEWTLATSYWQQTEGVIMEETAGVDFYNVINKVEYYGRRSIDIPAFPSSKIPRTARSLEDIMNGPVRKALGIIPSNVQWDLSSGPVFNALRGDFMKPVVHVVEDLLNNTNIDVFVVTGQLDLIVDTPGTVQWVERMRWKDKAAWLATPREPLVRNSVIEGYKKRRGKFGLYWVDRAGHMVPADNPVATDIIFRELTKNFSGK